VKLANADDEVVDSVSEDIKVATSDVADSDVLYVGADVSEFNGNVWGDTPGAVWGHPKDATAEHS